jgi:hypothetical protein
MFTQLNPTLPLHVLEKGKGYAVGLIDYGPEHNLIWVTVLNESGEVWCAPNPTVRFERNWTMGRSEGSAIARDKLAKSASGSEPCQSCQDKVDPSPVL